MTDPHNESSNPSETQEASVLVGVGTAVGAGTSAVLGGMGLAVGGTAVGIGMAPVAAAGAVTGAAAYGVKKAVEKQDPNALGAAAIGAGAGAGVSALLGGMGLAVGGTAVAVTMAPVAVIGGIVGLAGYGALQLFGDQKKHEEERRKRQKGRLKSRRKGKK